MKDWKKELRKEANKYGGLHLDQVEYFIETLLQEEPEKIEGLYEMENDGWDMLSIDEQDLEKIKGRANSIVITLEKYEDKLNEIIEVVNKLREDVDNFNK